MPPSMLERRGVGRVWGTWGAGCGEPVVVQPAGRANALHCGHVTWLALVVLPTASVSYDVVGWAVKDVIKEFTESIERVGTYLSVG